MLDKLTPLTLSIALAFAGAAHAAPEEKPDLRSRYTKYEFRIPMRDGVRLFTAVYVPKDSARSYPFLIERTPYSAGVTVDEQLRYGPDFYPRRLGPSEGFSDSGYIFVKQNVRGRFMSEGKWQEMTPHVKAGRAPGEGVESQDMHDTVEWLLKHVAGNNGKVGIYGISYPGFYTSASIIDSHPAIKAASPQAPVTDLYMNDDSYHGGAFMLAANFDFYAAFTEEKNPTPLPRTWSDFDYGVSDGYDYFLPRLTLGNILAELDDKQLAYLKPTIEHDSYDDFWRTRNIAPHLKNIRAAVLTVGGWFDAEDPQGPFTTYQAIGRQNQGVFNGLVIGPWVHGGWARGDGMRLGHVNFASKTSEYFNKHLLLPFFEEHLKGVKPAQAIAPVTTFETGTNVWRQSSTWPPQPAKARLLYLGPNGTLTWQQPAVASAFDEYVADPRKPVPYIGYPATGVPREYMVSDQRFAAKRPDVLVYQSEVLEQDVTIAGPINPRLFVSTSGSDSDFVVKLIDVYPQDYPQDGPAPEHGKDEPPPGVKMGGYQQLVRGNPLRGKFRHGFDKPQPFEPGKVERLDFHLGDAHHTFRRGHRIMVQVQSSWFPLIDLNPQTFTSIPKARPEDFVKATQRVYRTSAQPSALQLMVMP